MASRDRSLRDGNGRAARLARWLSTPPDSAAVDALALEHKEDGAWKRLQIWPRSHVTQALAAEIDATVTELANELGTYLTARVVWMVTESGAYWTEHALRVQPEDLDVAQAFAGDAQSIAVQNQRHQERIVSVHIGGFHSAIQALRETNADMRDIAQTTARENARLREELAAVRSELLDAQAESARLQQLLEEALSAAEASADRASDSEHEGAVVRLIGQAIGLPPPPTPSRAG